MLVVVTAVATIGAGVLWAAGLWAFLFRLPADGFWLRTWLTAAGLAAFAGGALAIIGRLDTAVGPVAPAEVAVGLAVGVTWLLATQVGYVVLRRLVPALVAPIDDLYRRGERGRDQRVVAVGAVVAMGVAEEVFFRGLVQNLAGLAVAVAVYGAVQLVEGKWALVLAAVLGALVWGGLYWWRDGLVAPVVAHVLWTTALTFVWPLGGGGRPTGRDRTRSRPTVVDNRPTG